MNWLYLTIIRTILVVILIILVKEDKSKRLLFPLISAILVGIYCLIYLLLFENIEKKDFNIKNIVIHTLIVFIVLNISYLAIKKCPNPAFFRAFVGLEIVLLILFGIIYDKYYINNINIIGSFLIIIGLILISCF